MKNEDVLKLAEKILEKLQKRDGVFLNNKKSFFVNNNHSFLFTEFELGNYIALILKKNHSIPLDFLSYYLKPDNNKQEQFIRIPKKLESIKVVLKNFRFKNNTLAGGSLAKTYLLRDKNKEIVIKKACGWPSQKLRNEAEFLVKLKNYREVEKHIPRVLDYKSRKDFALVTLEYFPYTTLSCQILFGKTTVDKAKENVVRVFDFVSKNLWVKEIGTPPEDYIKEFFLKRIKDNIQMMIQKSKFMADIVRQKNIYINGEIHKNLIEIADAIEHDPRLLSMLTPMQLSIIWGDLHPNNILITPKSFILIDPRGNNGDYLYDVCKMYHTLGPGRYDFIDNDLFDISVSKSKEYRITRRFLVDHPSWKMHEELEEYFLKIMLRYILPNDKYWELRWHFLNFCIFATMPLFLLKGELTENRALMGYSNALCFGKKFLEVKYTYDQK